MFTCLSESVWRRPYFNNMKPFTSAHLSVIDKYTHSNCLTNMICKFHGGSGELYLVAHYPRAGVHTHFLTNTHTHTLTHHRTHTHTHTHAHAHTHTHTHTHMHTHTQTHTHTDTHPLTHALTHTHTNTHTHTLRGCARLTSVIPSALFTHANGNFLICILF